MVCVGSTQVRGGGGSGVGGGGGGKLEVRMTGGQGDTPSVRAVKVTLIGGWRMYLPGCLHYRIGTIVKRRSDASFLPLHISWTCSFVRLLVSMLLTETSESLKVLIFWTFFDLSGDISQNMAWSMNSDPVHHDNLHCPMNSPFPLFPILALNKRKSTFKFSMGMGTFF